MNETLPITDVFVIPSKGSPLLTCGPCATGAPATVTCLGDAEGQLTYWSGLVASDSHLKEYYTALPLIWRGAPVPEGVDRAFRVLGTRRVSTTLSFVDNDCFNVSDALAMALVLVERGWATSFIALRRVEGQK